MGVTSTKFCIIFQCRYFGCLSTGITGKLHPVIIWLTAAVTFIFFVLFSFLVSGNHNSCFVKCLQDNRLCERAMDGLWLFPMLGLSKEISFVLVKLGPDCVEISLKRSSLIVGLRRYFQESQHGTLAMKTKCDEIWCTKQNTIRQPSKKGIILFIQELGITRNSNNKENSETKMAVSSTFTLADSEQWVEPRRKWRKL